MDVSFTDLFENGNSNSVKNIFDFLYNSNYNNQELFENIAQSCNKKYKKDCIIFNDLVNGDYSIIDKLTAIKKISNSSITS